MHLVQAYDPVRCLKASWALFKRAPATILLGALLPIAVLFGLSFAVQLLMLPLLVALQPMGRQSEPPIRLFVAFGCIGLALSLFQLLFLSWVDVGFARAIRAVRASGTEQIEELWRGLDRLTTMLVARLLIFLMCLAGYALAAGALVVLAVLLSTSRSPELHVLVLVCVLFASFVVAVYVALGLQFVTPIVALEQCGATEAIARSWQIASGRRWRLIVFWLFLLALNIAGFLACFFGLLLTVPLIETMRVEAYVALKQPSAPAPELPQSWSSEPS